MSHRTSHNDFQFSYLFKKEIKFLLTFRVLILLSLETLLKYIKRERQIREGIDIGRTAYYSLRVLANSPYRRSGFGSLYSQGSYFCALY